MKEEQKRADQLGNGIFAGSMDQTALHTRLAVCWLPGLQSLQQQV